METFNWIAFFALQMMYVYLAIFAIKDTIIDKLTKLYLYTESKKSKFNKDDWDSLNHSNFISKAPIFFALLKEGFLLFGLPFMASMFSVFIFGIVPVKNTANSIENIRIIVITIVCYYTFALVAIIYHRLSFRRYKDMAMMEKNLWDAKSIIYHK